ncbi:hypothetical protein CAEBREN_14663 [Caenorhabditis brenneri]|uniref:Uncharacterized protein n=1 Tax=Caenorhabditis brenneri TaxID=135651 RepID=G0PGS7_CAEBE|nr:hypothetical protein CAEBREN_14663 [Caenorhabditis brenneri]
MKVLFAVLFLLTVLCCTIMARPQFKAVDYKLYGDEEDPGVAVDSVYEIVEKAPDEKKLHHHNHTHKKKTNRLDRLKRYLAGWDKL